MRSDPAGIGVGPASADQKMTNYIIGFSFTAEMGLMGAYERTIGALDRMDDGRTQDGGRRVQSRAAEGVRAFLYQTPWFRFPFGEKLRQFWRETPFVPSIRAVERRGSLSLQYAARYAYAALMRFVAGYDPADLTIRSVVGGLTPSDLAAMRDVKVIREVTDASGVRGVLVETARYAAFDAFVKALGQHPDASLLEIAGNHRILVTAIAPEGLLRSWRRPMAWLYSSFRSSPCPAHGGSASMLPVRSLVQDVKNFEATGYKFEHVYDY